MNLPTHITFGALIGALFFGRWDIILLFAIGSILPDMDREYGFFSKDYFRKHQLHRALYHNFFFIGILSLINPYGSWLVYPAIFQSDQKMFPKSVLKLEKTLRHPFTFSPKTCIYYRK